ncbi:DUF6339 family protein [Natronomonas moolapensis]|uniref:DUF6339 family protein n=1 Tax=Natronomonas moolapensis TaxID=416273 RepID=UPI00126038AF|nr:DUF6339 family protein [Natronomonas moolapensis]
MTTIHILTDSGQDLVKSHDSFPEEEDSQPPTEELENHLRTLEVDEATIDFNRLNEAVNSSMTVFDLGRRRQRTAMDSNLAPIVHQCIDVPPRVAAVPGMWHYLALLRYPEFITSRWSQDDDVQEKFLGTQKDLYSNHLARLWWGAQLTYDKDGDHYFATHRLFNKQRLVNYVLDSSFRRYRPAAIAFAEELWNESGKNITSIAKRFNNSLSTTQLEARSKDEIRGQLTKIRDHVENTG